MSNTNTNTNIQLANINIGEIETVLLHYLNNIHPKTSNGFIIRLLEPILNPNNQLQYEKREMHIVNFPLHFLNQSEIHNIIDKWTEYALENILINDDITQEFTIGSIDPF